MWSCSRAGAKSQHLPEGSLSGSTEKPLDPEPAGGNRVNTRGQIYQPVSPTCWQGVPFESKAGDAFRVSPSGLDKIAKEKGGLFSPILNIKEKKAFWNSKGSGTGPETQKLTFILHIEEKSVTCRRPRRGPPTPSGSQAAPVRASESCSPRRPEAHPSPAAGIRLFGCTCKSHHRVLSWSVSNVRERAQWSVLNSDRVEPVCLTSAGVLWKPVTAEFLHQSHSKPLKKEICSLRIRAGSGHQRFKATNCSGDLSLHICVFLAVF